MESCFDKDCFIDIVNSGIQTDIDNYFISVLQRENITLDDIKFMVENGANPRANNDQLFVDSCAFEDINIPIYFINVHGVNIRAHNEGAFSNALFYQRKSTCKMLVDNGAVITDDIITNIVVDNKYYLFDLLGELGVETDRIAKIFLEFNFNLKHSKEQFMMLKNLSNNCDNLGEIIAQHVCD